MKKNKCGNCKYCKVYNNEFGICKNKKSNFFDLPVRLVMKICNKFK